MATEKMREKKQQIIDSLNVELTKKDQEKISQLLEKKTNDERYYDLNYGHYGYVYFNKKHNIFHVCKNNYNEIREMHRLYPYDNLYIPATIYQNKTWRLGIFSDARYNYKIINIEEVYNLPYKNYLRKLHTVSLFHIINSMKVPEIEQLINMGYDKLANICCRHIEIKISLNNILGKPIKKSNNICTEYGMTNKQIGYIDHTLRQNEYLHILGTAETLKKILLIEQISSIGNDFEKYYDILSKCKRWMISTFSIFKPEDRKKIFIKLSNFENNKQAFQVFADTVLSYYGLNKLNRPNIDFTKIKNIDELGRIHDQVLELTRLERIEKDKIWREELKKRNAYLEEKMTKIDKTRSTLNYEENDFLIKIPETLAEITDEGNNLHHCVENYIGRHANGDTTIIFLRRKEEPDKSFYTIELGTDNQIVQIHGFGNKWLGNNPEAIPTVVRWIRKNNLKCSDEILRGTAQGYHGNNILVDMPEI